ncbi:unnamed protein product [Protopolystoma xenopodis]|uniref:Uncharacterized protein n=1 Tax=Protopolystoma xenopodis TaxID=117903 RepID=A0A3S4ZWX4_9PLAT|nr:unnamed protein product [Protopolystoma xenopodis]
MPGRILDTLNNPSPAISKVYNFDHSVPRFFTDVGESKGPGASFQTGLASWLPRRRKLSCNSHSASADSTSTRVRERENMRLPYMSQTSGNLSEISAQTS